MELFIRTRNSGRYPESAGGTEYRSLDGARLGYGLMSRGTDVTLEDTAGFCDVFYIGGTKVGALCGEAVVFPKKAPRHFLTTVKQHGALLTKGGFWVLARFSPYRLRLLSETPPSPVSSDTWVSHRPVARPPDPNDPAVYMTMTGNVTRIPELIIDALTLIRINQPSLADQILAVSLLPQIFIYRSSLNLFEYPQTECGDSLIRESRFFRYSYAVFPRSDFSCAEVCPRGAISMVNGKSFIDQEKCIKCGKCKSACPYDAIAKKERPCQKACGVNAIVSDKYGRAFIDNDKCVSCGMCMVNCPFGAISDKSQIFQLARALSEGEEIVAEIAPAFVGQFGDNITPRNIKAALWSGSLESAVS